MKSEEKTDRESVVLSPQSLYFEGKENFPVNVYYGEKKYVLFLTKNNKLMLQKAI